MLSLYSLLKRSVVAMQSDPTDKDVRVAFLAQLLQMGDLPLEKRLRDAETVGHGKASRSELTEVCTLTTDNSSAVT